MIQIVVLRRRRDRIMVHPWTAYAWGEAHLRTRTLAMATESTKATHGQHLEPLAFRDTELFALSRAMGSHRVVVLTGPPGIGKSTLAHAFAKQKRRGREPDSVVSCRLDEARSAMDVVHEMARVLGVTMSAFADVPAISDRVGRALLSRRRVLVVLDDVDRSRAALAKLVADWCAQAPLATFLVTARGRLNIAGEQRLEVGALDVPSTDVNDPDAIAACAAVQLFARKALVVRPGFRITASNARTVAAIVRKLEGVPLAIELCASRMVALSERDILDLLEERLDLLEDERGERSIRSAFALSWEELDAEDARLLSACSCFRGGFFLHAACDVAGHASPEDASSPAKTRVRVARGIERLVDASLLHVDDSFTSPPSVQPGANTTLPAPPSITAERRYRVPETLRAFAAEKLADLADRSEIEARFAHHYASLRSRVPPASLEEIVLERMNLEAAFDLAITTESADAAAVLLSYAPVALTRGPLGPFIERVTLALDRLVLLSDGDRAELLYVRGLARVFQGKRDEGLVDLSAASRDAKASRSLRVFALATAKMAVVVGLKGEIDEALRLFEEARVAADDSADDRTRGVVRKDLANVLSEAGRNDDAVVELNRARQFLRAAGDSREEGFVLMMLGSRFVDDGRLAEARRDCSAALALLRHAGDRRSEGWTLGLLSLVDLEEGDTSAARRHLDTAIALIRDVGDEHTEGLLLGFLGNVALEQGVLPDAETAYRDAIVKLARAGDRASEGLFTAGAAVVEHALGRTPSARDLFDRARVLLEGDGRAARRKAVEILARVLDLSAHAAPSHAMDSLHSTDEDAARSTEGGPPGPEGDVEEIRFARRVLAQMTSRRSPKPSAPPSAITPSTSAVRGGVGDPPSSRRTVHREGASDAGHHDRSAGLVVASDGSWVRTPAGDLAKLGAGRPIARVMHQLALERARHPGKPVPPEALVRAGWPGERVLPAAAKNRLHVTIARLRRVGLEGVLLHDDEGYFLDAKAGARLADPGEPPPRD